MNLGITENLKKILMANPEKLEAIKSSIEHYVEEYKRIKSNKNVDAASLARSFHILIDGIVADTRLSTGVEQPSCKKGCAHCCYIQVDMFKEEAELIMKFIEHEKIEIDWERVRLQAQVKEIRHLEHKYRACVFLGPDNQCKIYEARPIACRKYFVQGDPEKCNSEKHPKGSVRVYSVNFAEIVASALYSVSKTESIAKQLLKIKNGEEE